MQEPVDLHQLECDLEGVRLLPNLERVHKFICSLPYQDKYVFISSLNQALVSVMLLQKHTKKCMWMLLDVYSRHGFPVEIGWSQVVLLDRCLREEWMWNEMKRLCAFVLVDDGFKGVVKKVRAEVQEIKRQLQRWHVAAIAIVVCCPSKQCCIEATEHPKTNHHHSQPGLNSRILQTKGTCILQNMGLLRVVKALDWEDLVKEKESVKMDGVLQFARVYSKHRQDTTEHYWGDEIELMVCARRDRYCLALCSDCVVTQGRFSGTVVSVEYARYMLETMPEAPFDMSLDSFLGFERRLEDRRAQICTQLVRFVSGGFPLLISCFPSLKDRFVSADTAEDVEGGDDSADAPSLTYNITRSASFPDNAISRHSRFTSFTENIIRRRGKAVEGYVKIMKDLNTKDTGNREGDAVLIDSMGQGMGCCSLQLTMQYRDLSQARYQYDTLGVLGPLMLRMSRATSVANGYLLNTETRWDIVGFSVDCRTDSERMCEYEKSGCEAGSLKTDGTHIRKSRFSSIDMFISNDEMNLDEYNDVSAPNVPNLVETLMSHGVDPLMSKHVGSLFARDPLLTYERPGQAGEYTDDFDNIQSSNWRSVRLKMPSGSESRLNGWKVEFRTMEIQPTSFENAAFVLFVVLLSRAVVHYGLNLYIPMSLVEHNFSQANKLNRMPEEFGAELQPDSVLFYYRSNIHDKGPPTISRGTLDDIFNGREGYEGILRVVRRYVGEVLATEKLDRYLDFIAGRCSGKYMSVSEYVRGFVLNHRMYDNDSVVREEVIDDLIARIKAIEENNDPSYLLSSNPG
ncbi:UNVERIFIED_CONTAM: hypothetical protein PYX00_011545 [Menopon gallinae]|uniref:Glutamate--cysteine ligase n=1 Tax=Menopon gallinae TaxID=328185 RepID=A0AAW2H7X3_9NEOP